MIWFEPQTFGVGSDNSINWATTTAQYSKDDSTRKFYDIFTVPKYV